MKISATNHQMEQVNKLLTKIFNIVARKVEGIKRNIPYLKEKKNIEQHYYITRYN